MSLLRSEAGKENINIYIYPLKGIDPVWEKKSPDQQKHVSK